MWFGGIFKFNRGYDGVESFRDSNVGAPGSGVTPRFQMKRNDIRENVLIGVQITGPGFQSSFVYLFPSTSTFWKKAKCWLVCNN